ncbi:MAG: 3-dehydroquinate synthase [Candidatus Omnitrophica bacterium]|nr:3-dehydroquinate synthase [Candidatus Omnitrophota bacterium]
MKKILVELGKRSYYVYVGEHLLSKLGVLIKPLKLAEAAFIISNLRLKQHFGNILEKSLSQSGRYFRWKIIPDTEKSKSLFEVARILDSLNKFQKKRSVFIIALGGGVVGDVAGFVASIFRRGVAYIQVPTTLLAQVDSSIGGKTAVDLPDAKNIVGTFYQPRLVVSSIDTLYSLDRRQLSSGLAEVIKYAIIEGNNFFEYLEKNVDLIMQKKPNVLEYIVSHCAAIKARIVSCDEKEEYSIRTVLNFGHTIGHAIEAAAGFSRYTHGEAIALGMLVACGISQHLGLVRQQVCQRIEALIARYGLPTYIKEVSLREILRVHYYDKKFKGKMNTFVLLRDVGKVSLYHNVPIEIIKEAIKKRME